MNAGKAVYGILSANSGVTDIVGTRIFPEIAEQEAVTPFVIYQLQSVAPEDTHDGPSKLDEVRFEFLCYADSYNAAADLGVAVRAALDRVSGTYNGVNVESVQFNDVDVEIEYDPRRYSQVLKFTFRIKRDDVTIALGTPVTGAELGDLSDVDVSGVTNGQLIAYNSTTGNWEAADDAGGAEQINDLTDVNVALPDEGEFLKYDGAEWVNDNVAISNVTGLQAQLDTIPDNIDDLDDVKIVGTPAEGDALVYQSGFWSRGTAGASTLDELDDVQVPTPSSGAVLQYNGTYWAASALSIPSVPSTYYHQRYSSEAQTLLDGATDTVELYYTAQADGDGLHEDAQSNTPSAGNVIRRKLWYAEKAQADPDTTADWTQFADIADDTAYATAKATLLAYLKARTGGTVPISLKMTWEDITAAPSFTGLLNESYGSGAEAAYSTRRLNGNYSGAAIEVERSSDNTTQDIGFDSNGDLDESALTTFCTGTTCKVRTWYDQSQTGGTGSGNDAVQTTHANQPTIYTGGALVKENGKVAMQGGLDIFLPHGHNPQNDAKFFGVVKVVSQAMLLGTENTGEFIFAAQSGSSSTNYAAAHTINTQKKDGSTYTGTKRGDIYSDFGNRSLLYLDYEATSVTGTVGRFGYPTLGTWGMYQLQEAIWYPDTSTNPITSIEENIGDYFTQNTPLLDTYSGAAAAYSLRLLDSTYTGDAVEVYNGSSYADIGFNVFGELDTVALAAHCGSNDGFVSKFYDQSGNSNTATQTTTANMPKIYDGTTGVITENGKPAVEFDGLNDVFALPITLDNTVYYNNFVVCTPTGSDDVVLNLTNGTDVASISYGRTAGQVHASTRLGATTIQKSGAHTISTQGLFSSNHDFSPQVVDLYIDGVQQSGTLVGRVGLGASTIGGQSLTSRTFAGQMQEVIIYASDQSSNRTNIEDNINTFYDIYS